MLIITLSNITAVWHTEDFEWVSGTPHIAANLNLTVPIGIKGVDVGFRVGGHQKMALDAAIRVFGNAVKVVKHTEEEMPPEKEGIDY